MKRFFFTFALFVFCFSSCQDKPATKNTQPSHQDDLLDQPVTRQNVAQVITDLKQLSAQGNKAATKKLSDIFMTPKLGVQDSVSAFFWTLSAADQGNMDCMYRVGLLYFDGIGTPKDANTGFSWMQKSAELGHADAMYRVGLSYEFGLGVSSNAQRAKEYYLRAAEKGNGAAQLNLGKMYEFAQDSTQIDDKQAYKWYKQAAEKGLTVAQHNYALLNLKGKGTSKNVYTGFTFMKKAAEKNYPSAQFWLGLLYLEGQGVTKDIEEGKHWINESRKNGDRRAQTVWDNNKFKE